MSDIVKIIIADDHSMIREGLKQLLELDGDIQVIGEAPTRIATLNRPRKIFTPPKTVNA